MCLCEIDAMLLVAPWVSSGVGGGSHGVKTGREVLCPCLDPRSIAVSARMAAFDPSMTLAQNFAGLTKVLLTEVRASSVAFALSSGEGIMTHVRTLAYFSAFLGTLGFVLIGFPWHTALRERPTLLLCVPYSLIALLMTWRLILSFMINFQVSAHTPAHLVPGMRQLALRAPHS